MASPNVTYILPEIARLLPEYYLIRDCLSGETAVKAAKTKYLPKPNAEDTSPQNTKRYEAYLQRAVFFNFTRFTLNGLLGQIFSVDPVVKLPPLLASVETNSSGKGVTLAQQCKKTAATVLAYSRGGLLVDFPQTNGEVTAAQIQSGEIRPTITEYSPMEIINWRIGEQGALELLTLVVLREGYVFFDDGFEQKTACQFRVLKLENGAYVQELWREPVPTTWTAGQKTPSNSTFALVTRIVPTDGNGNPFTEIPFMFIGAMDNDPSPDNPVFYDLASLNIAHYRNSADYEEACFIVGQPTLLLVGLTEEWNEKVLKGKVAMGSRGGIPLPVGGDGKLLQAEANMMIKEAMDAKERQAVALGAKLVEQKQVQRTAFEAKLEATSEGSFLSSVTRNVESAYLWALKWCARFLALPEDGIEFKLNSDFEIAKLGAEERRQVIEEWQKGAITFGEMRNVLRKAKIATEDDEKAKQQISDDQINDIKQVQGAMSEFNDEPPVP